jgi:copper chaperone CopZ
MKTRIILLSFLLVAGTISSAYSQITSANLTAAGLTCAMCSKSISSALQQLHFVSDVRPDINQSAFDIKFKPGSQVNFDQLKEAVEDAGFSVAKLKLTGTFDKVSIQNDAHVTIDGNVFHFLNVSPQVLQGSKSITIVDKNFVNAKEFKKYASFTKMNCVHTGRSAQCCTDKIVPANSRIYHVTI